MTKIKHTGFSLVELLIAMVISLVLVFACASVYSSLRTSIDISQKLSSAQESLRTAHYLMARSIRHGYGLKVSGAGAAQSIVITYGEKAELNPFYGCLGERQYSNATDTFFVKNDSNNNKQLHCTTRTSAAAATNAATGPGVNTQIVALGVESISASLPTSSASADPKGIDVALVIDGMPDDMKVNGFTFSLAMRQRILTDSGVSGASASNAGLGTN